MRAIQLFECIAGKHHKTLQTSAQNRSLRKKRAVRLNIETQATSVSKQIGIGVKDHVRCGGEREEKEGMGGIKRDKRIAKRRKAKKRKTE